MDCRVLTSVSTCLPCCTAPTAGEPGGHIDDNSDSEEPFLEPSALQGSCIKCCSLVLYCSNANSNSFIIVLEQFAVKQASSLRQVKGIVNSSIDCVMTRTRNAFGALIYSNVQSLGRNTCAFHHEQYSDVKEQVRANAVISTSGGSSSSSQSYYTPLSEQVLSSAPLRFFMNEDDEVRLLVGPNLHVGTAYTIAYVSDLPGVDRILRPSTSASLSPGQERLYKKFTMFLSQVHVGIMGPFQCANKLVIPSSNEERNACLLWGDRPIPVYRELLPSFIRMIQVVDFRISGRSSRCKKMFHVTSNGTIRPSDIDDKIIYLG